MVHVGGPVLSAEAESNANPLKVDHIWIVIDVGQPVRLAVNTVSRRNRDAGFDGRIRMAQLREPWAELPAPFVHPHEGLDYALFERGRNVYYEMWEQPALESYFLRLLADAPFVEAWGEPYRGQHLGLHQIHSRAASCAVGESIPGHDGALRIYRPSPKERILFLLKFCGQ